MHPPVQPPDAEHNAWLWQQHAQRLDGAEREQALRHARAWADLARRPAVASWPPPIAGERMPQPPAGAPQSPAGASQSPAGASQPPGAPSVHYPAYPSPNAAAGRSGGIGLGIGLAVAAAVVIPFLIVVAVVASGIAGGFETDARAEPVPSISSAPTAAAPAPAPPAPVETEAPAATPEQLAELERLQRQLDWREGRGWTPVPEPVPGAVSPGRFMTDYATPEDWLSERGIDGIRIVVTDDPALNCGFAYPDSAEFDIAGCYWHDYGKTIFLSWDAAGYPNDAMRELVLAHEYSHFLQSWSHYDVVTSAYDQGFGSDPEWTSVVESDATCRVLSWGGYSEEAAERSASPCRASDWDEGWLERQAIALGVVLPDTH